MKTLKILMWSLCLVLFSCDSDESTTSDPEEKPTEVGAPVSEPPVEEDPENEPPAEPVTQIDLMALDASVPSFVSINDTTPEDMKWTKVEDMSDEFEKWDDEKWENSFWNYDGTPVWMTDKNSGVEDGKLFIKATLRDDPVSWFQTARIHSKAQISFPMYTECSMKAANISAFNTFWLNNGDIDNRDEIDIVENNPNPTPECRDQSTKPADFPWTPWLFPTQMNSQYFIAENSVTERHEDNFDTRFLSDANPNKGKTWDEAYHIVGAWWIDERNVQFYLNGEPAGKITTQQDFTRELEIIWDLWTFKDCNIGGLPQKEELNDDTINTMRVDWVRTWKLEAK